MLVSGWTLKERGLICRAVFCRVMLELDGDLGNRARRPQAFRGTTRDESRKIPREEGKCNVGE